MAHTPVHLKPIPVWKRLWRRLGGHNRRLAELSQRAQARATPASTGELWTAGTPARRTVPLDVRDQPIAYTPPTAVDWPEAWLQQAAFILAQDTGVVVGVPRLRVLIPTALARQAQAAGGITAEVRAGLREALGRELTGQGWPTQADRLAGYRLGVRLAAQAAGLDVLAPDTWNLEPVSLG